MLMAASIDRSPGYGSMDQKCDVSHGTIDINIIKKLQQIITNPYKSFFLGGCQLNQSHICSWQQLTERACRTNHAASKLKRSRGTNDATAPGRVGPWADGTHWTNDSTKPK